jgi:tripartite-type tricarboxylate transporter receptor subunit TctC
MKSILKGTIGALSLLVACSVAAKAQNWPTQNITIVVPFTPGGSNDVTARLLAPELQMRLKQSVIIENKPGSGGYVGVGAVARAKPDGYTLLISSASSHVFANLTKRDANYDPRKSFEAIGLINDVPLALSLWPGLGVKSLNDLVTLAKTRPEGLFFGSSGTGSSTHFAGELFAMKTGTKLTHVPYPGGSQALTDLISGRIQLAWLTLPTASAQGEAGTIQNLGITSQERTSVSPLPTIMELGLPGYYVGSWTGLFAPQGLDPALRTRLANDLREIVADAAFQKRLVDIGSVPAWKGPQQTDDFIRAEFSLWEPVVRKVDIK